MKSNPTNVIRARIPKSRNQGASYFLRPLAVALLSLAAATTSSFGATINYGNFGPVVPGVTFLGVTESSGTDPVPLYGPPTPFATGLDFDPLSFLTSSTGGAVDITDGQLNMTIHASPGVGIDDISIFEAGDYTLAGVGTAATAVQIGSILRLTVTEIDGVDVPPISLVPVNASVGFNFLSNPGLAQPWSLGIGANIAAQVPGKLVTEVEVVIDNVLVSLSEFSSVSFGAKKDIQLSVRTVDSFGTIRTTAVPEAGSTVWLTAGGISLVLLGRRWTAKRQLA